MKTIRTLCLFIALVTGVFAGGRSSQMDGEQVYRDNCTRCHIAFHTFSPRMMATVTHHMQVRAMLTRGEQQAVLEYLLETSASVEPRKKTTSKGK